MAGLTDEGFTPLSLDEIKTRIKSKLEVYNPGFDFTVDSPDGQLVEIFSFELAQAWSELDLVYKSYDPNQATGAALKNLGQITGIPFGGATFSTVNLQLVGTAETLIPKGSLVTDADGNEFATDIDAYIASTVSATATVAGPIQVPAGTVVNIKTPVTGWTSVTQTADGTAGAKAQTETEYRNIRNKTVLRNFTSVQETMQARLLELGIEQANVINNDSLATLPDGTPPQTIHVTVGEIAGVSDEDIASTILATKGLGCPTFGSTTVAVEDYQGYSHDVKFSKATGVDIYMDIEVTYLSEETAGATEDIRAALVAHINGLAADEDVIWSRLFGIITPFGKAQVDKLEIGKTALGVAVGNVAIAADEYAQTIPGYINITVN